MTAWQSEKLYKTDSAKAIQQNKVSLSAGTTGSWLSQTVSSRNLYQSKMDQRPNMESYRVVFWGQCAEGYELGDVCRAFSKRFNIQNPRQLNQLFSGKVLTLKRGLSEQQANRYVSVIQMLGGVCRKESEHKNYFEESEFKARKSVSFLEDDFDPSTLSLAPKDEFSTET